MDYGKSYLLWSVPYNPRDERVPGHKPWGNSARILFDARCVLTDEGSGETDEFFLIVPCRTEWMYQEENLFELPSKEYRGVFSRTRHLGLGVDIKPSVSVDDHFTSFEIVVSTVPRMTALETDEAAVQATLQGLPLVAQTEILDEERHMRAMIEYPIKTMNIHPERKRFQVDTGPLLWPDFRLETEHWVDRFTLAHVVYNTFDRAEFIIRRSIPIVAVFFGGVSRDVTSIQQYSEIKVHPARHTLLCAGQI